MARLLPAVGPRKEKDREKQRRATKTGFGRNETNKCEAAKKVRDMRGKFVNIDLHVPGTQSFVKIVKKRTVSCPGTRVVARHA